MRTHCCRHIAANTNVSLFAHACNICCRHKFCVHDTKKVSDFVQKHFVSATNVSQFVQHGNTTFILCLARDARRCFLYIVYSNFSWAFLTKGERFYPRCTVLIQEERLTICQCHHKGSTFFSVI